MEDIGNETEGQITFTESVNVYMLSLVNFKAVLGIGSPQFPDQEIF